jgi:outer membrane lipoprotein-sorting protein
MRRLATLPARRLWAIAAAVVLVVAGAGVAQAALSSGGPKPAPKPLNVAVRDALNAPQVKGITARIKFTNNLLPAGATGRGATTPLLTGATGRLWLADDGRARLELQSDSGDAQIVTDGKTVTLYDASSNTVYRAKLPADKGSAKAEKHAPATLGQINKGLAQLSKAWTVSRAIPTDTAHQPSFTVRLSPKDDGGLLGAAEVAWDAAKGIPLRAAIYAQGQKDPVLQLEATDISYGTVNSSALTAKPPAGAKVVQVNSLAGNGKQHAAMAGKGKHRKPVSGASAVARRLPFHLSAPRTLAGLPRKSVELISFGGQAGALSTYGRGLGAIVVFQHKADASSQKPTGALRDLPKINIDGATGTELATALGTVVTFDRNGVSYIVAGSVPPVAAENVARGLK